MKSAWAMVLLAPVAALAEPYLAVREGFACSQCHVNRTGGGMRTGFGRIYSATSLPRWRGLPESGVGLLDAMLGEMLVAGADLRFANQTSLPARTRWEGQTLESPLSNSFEVAVGNVYLEVPLWGDHLALYFDEIVTPESASSREAAVLLRRLPLGAYLKVGRLLLPGGIRLADDEAAVREVTDFNYGNQDLGLEVGVEPLPLFVHLAVSNGTQGGGDNNNEKQVAGLVGAVFRHVRGGLSLSWNDGSTREATARTGVLSVFGAVGAGRVVLMGEAAVVEKHSAPGKRTRQLATHAELDVLVVRGLNVRASYEFHDPDLQVPENQRIRAVLALDLFPLSFLHVSAAYRLRADIPQLVGGNADQLVIQVHGFF